MNKITIKFRFKVEAQDYYDNNNNNWIFLFEMFAKSNNKNKFLGNFLYVIYKNT
jgi:hypothetical protein